MTLPHDYAAEPRTTELSTAGRKVAHVDVCLAYPVEFQTRTTGFERYDLPYSALPETDLAAIDLETRFLGKTLRAPVLIGAMTGGAEHALTINRNLAIAAETIGVGLMLGSQRVMLEDPRRIASFAVRGYAPHALLIGNLGVAQLNRGYGAAEITVAIESIGADGLALHANPLQEATQIGGDGDFRGLVSKLDVVANSVAYPLVLKEVGHGMSATVAQNVAGVGLAALDVAGAGGTSWARVEQFVSYGEIRHPDLAEWGISTSDALRGVHAVVPDVPLIASGGIRTGLDAAKALALGATVVAIALPLVRPALHSPEAVIEWLEKFLWELRTAMHCAAAASIDQLRDIELLTRSDQFR